MAEQLEPMENPDEGSSPGNSPPDGFWARWDSATRDSGSVKRNLVMLFGVTLAATLCIWSLGGAIAIIVGSVHAWSVAGTGIGVASVLTVVGIQLRRKRPQALTVGLG